MVLGEDLFHGSRLASGGFCSLCCPLTSAASPYLCLHPHTRFSCVCAPLNFPHFIRTSVILDQGPAHSSMTSFNSTIPAQPFFQMVHSEVLGLQHISSRNTLSSITMLGENQGRRVKVLWESSLFSLLS